MENRIFEILRTVKYPGFSRDIVSFGLVKSVDEGDGHPVVKMALTTADPQMGETIRLLCEEALRGTGIPATVLMETQAPPQPGTVPVPQPIEGVQRVIAIGSGKGGVGKSTVSTQLALAFARAGKKVGICDCDVYGPSLSQMFGCHERPLADEQERIVPVECNGNIKLLSMGMLLDDAAPAAMRGPMVTRIMQQFLRHTAWAPLDVLILDLPPGTNDIHLTIAQTVVVDGAIIVTTPQEIALLDARKAAGFFEKTNIPILGIVENMSYFECPGDGKRYDIFGSGGGEREATRLNTRLLAQIPIEIPVREAGDTGLPLAADSTARQAFDRLASCLQK